MTPRKLRVPMFFKFLIGCLALAALLIVGGSIVVKNETRLRSRGNFLQRQDRRLEGYMERVGRDMTATLQLLATDDELQKAMTAAAAEPSERAGGGDPDGSAGGAVRRSRSRSTTMPATPAS